jgi:TM2 domain-containing membrane protein YozV
MPLIDPVYTATMSPHQRDWFYAEYEQASRDEVVGVLLALFLGSFGIHHFYLRRNGLGVLYLVFSWTGIPAILGLIEAFLMPGRVRQYNATQASFIAGQILAGAAAFYAQSPMASVPCGACGGTVTGDAGFCPHCGAVLAKT